MPQEEPATLAEERQSPRGKHRLDLYNYSSEGEQPPSPINSMLSPTIYVESDRSTVDSVSDRVNGKEVRLYALCLV